MVSPGSYSKQMEEPEWHGVAFWPGKDKVPPPLTALACIPCNLGLVNVFAVGCTCGSPFTEGHARGENMSLERRKEFLCLMSWHFLGCERKKSTHLDLVSFFLFCSVSKTTLLYFQQVSATRKDSQSCVWDWWGLWEGWGKDGGNCTGFFKVPCVERDFSEKRWGKELFMNDLEQTFNACKN